MSIKDQQVSVYDVLAVLANEWIGAVPAFYVHDDNDSMEHVNGSAVMMDIMSKALGAPTTMVNFVKAYMKTEYVKAFKEYLASHDETFADAHLIGALPIKITQADIDSV
jgi:hypothetical protein